MDASVFAHALLLNETTSRASIVALLPAELRGAVEAELARMESFSPEKLRESLTNLRSAQAARQRELAEEKLGYSLKYASPVLAAWLARSF
ncbi:flagellar motor switch protein FliG [Silvibacterium bohemicum]|uniref:Flagellar motor switch protein FliG n=1 Tax=Silvibacterium bohemicum TaxID=1577686 RepID=A0A841JMV5_9BACT|nr:hypothetical protein [Silvibacterium bohemicum]MBB6142573.1 flagellar motor switch protein FliG [Silvibacterium bohemicum]